MEVRKTPLRDGDGLGDQACVAVDLAPLAGQTPVEPGGDVAGKTVPHKPRWNNTTRGNPPWVSNIVKMVKNDFLNLRGTIGWKLPVGTSPARHWAPVWRKANLRDAPPSKLCISGNSFARRPFLWNPLGPPLTWRQLTQRLFGLGGTKNRQWHFSNQVNTIVAR